MTDKKDDCSMDTCPVDKTGATSMLVKSTDLPLNGDPYPPKDIIQNETSGALEQAVTSARTTIQPYLSPVCAAYSKANQIISISVAHSQSALQDLSEKQNALTNGIFITGSTLFGLFLARRKGFIKKTFSATVFLAGSAALCNRDQAKEYFDICWVIAKNNFPSLISHNYQKLSGQISSSSSNKEQKTEEK